MQIDPNFNAKLEAIAKAKSEGEMSDNVSIYIGFSLLVLGFLNGIADVPDAFIIGASISGLCFAMIDIIIIGDNLKRFIQPLMIIGIFCLFLLPIILTLYPHPLVLKFFRMYSDMGTFYALGFVMIALGVKSRKAKQGFITMTAEAVGYLAKVNEQVYNETEQFKHKVMNMAKEQSENIEEHERKVARLEEELESIKALANIDEPKQ